MKNFSLFFFSVTFAVLLTIFLVRYHFVGQAVYGDGIYYWAYTRSLVMDHDLDLRNEGGHSYGPESNNSFTTEKQSDQTDLARNKYYPVGTSLLWTPFFLLASAIVAVLNNFGFSLARNGYSDMYQIIVGFGNIFFVIAGLIIIFKLLKRFYSEKVSLLACLTLLFATNLLYYASLDVLNSHPSAFLVSSLLVYLWAKTLHKRPNAISLLLGTLLGILGTIRLQDTLLGALFLVELAVLARNQKNKRFEVKIFIQRLPGLLLVATGFCIGFLSQLIVSKIIYGKFLLLPYTLGKDLFHPLRPALLEMVFNPERGLLFFGPVILVGTTGIIFFFRKNRALQIGSLVAITLECLVIAIWSGWSQGEAFGMRMLITLMPFFALGLTAVIDKLSRIFSYKLVIIVALLFILQNALMIISFHLFLHGLTYVGEEISRSGKIKMKIIESIQ